MTKIPKSEFVSRTEHIQEKLARNNLDGLMVYGDEYRKENLRYASNFWPIFERAACFIPRQGRPLLVCAPEGEKYAREMTICADIRNIKEFACVSVPEEIDFPLAAFSSFSEVLKEILKDGKRLGIAGIADMPSPILERVRRSIDNLAVKNADFILNELRIVKTENEIACLKEAGRQACCGYKKLMQASVPGNTEVMASAAAEGAARAEGAEAINFMIFGSGKRADTVIGRGTQKVIKDGDMIMAALAVQYEGYVATAEFPFVAGKATREQKDFLNVLFEAANTQLEYLKEGVVAGEMVKAVRNVFRKHKLEKYDVYPPMHGIGLAEAESPYPDEKAVYKFQDGMCVNSDISLFGHPDGSNRIEEGFVIRRNGPESLTPFIRELCQEGDSCKNSRSK